MNEVKVLKSEISRLKSLVEEKRREIKTNSLQKQSSPQKLLVEAISSRPSSSSSTNSSALLISSFRNSNAFSVAASNYSASSGSSYGGNGNFNNMVPFQAPTAANHSSSSAVSSSSATSTLANIEFNSHLLNRLLKSQESLNPEEVVIKKKILDSLTLSPVDIEITKTRVGRGVFGDVCLGTLRNRYKIAIKTLKRSNDFRKDEHRKKLIEKEMLITKYLGSYPTIPVCYGYVTNDTTIQVILELAPYGSLSLILGDNQSFPIIPVGLKIAWLSDLADAIRFLHSKEIMHKNICADNLLVFDKLRIKLSDFGPEKQSSNSTYKAGARSEGDSKAFIAPEVREGKNPEYGSDIFSYSVTAIQLFSRRVPHLERAQEQILSSIEKEWIEPVESKESLKILLSKCLQYDPNEHVNSSRPNAEELFQDILTILETVGGDPREEARSNDFCVVQELEATARQKRNEMLRHKSSYKSNLALRNSSSYNNSSRRSGNLSSQWLLRSSFRGSAMGNNNHPNLSTFSYSHLKAVNENASVNGDLLSQSLDLEDKASIAYFLIQAVNFTPLEADFMADRLVRKGVSCVSTLKRKLHRDSNYLASIGVDKETAKRISTALLNVKSPASESKNVFLNQSNSSSNNLLGGNSPRVSRRNGLSNSNSSSARTFYNGENEGQTDRDNESDSLDSATDQRFTQASKKTARFTPSTKGVSHLLLSSASKRSASDINIDKEMTAESLEEEEEEDEYSNLRPKSENSNAAEKLFIDSKHMMDKRNILSKFLRVEINLSPDLANKYSDILISREIYDLNTLNKQLINDNKVLIKYGFDKKISNQIFDHMTKQLITRFQDENSKTQDLDMGINAHTIVNNVSAINSPASVITSSSNNLKDYVSENCFESNPLDTATLYYEASQLSNADSLEKLLEIAENGDYLAQGFLMRMYGLGQGDVKQDIIVAKEMGTKLFPWLQHAIQTENSAQVIMLARYLTGVCYSLGLGVPQNDGEAIKWYLQSAHQGYIGAQAYLGYCYYLGVGVEKNLKEAFNWYKISALRGHSASQCNLGLCFEYGHGTDKNLQEAIKWYRASADQGDVIAQYSLGNIYEKGKSPISQNMKEAFKYYKLSAEKGYDQAQYSLGCCYYAGLGVEQNLEDAFNFFQLAAHNGNASAQCKLGFCYENGIGTEKNIVKAIEYYRFAAEQGNAAAMYYLGYCYFTGMGIETSVSEAVKLYTLSAQKKYPAAQNNLGFCYFNGIGVEKNLELAIKWYTEAAHQEYPAAQYNLGYCYEKGLGVAVNPQESMTWYQKASKNGHARARKSLKRLNSSA